MVSWKTGRWIWFLHSRAAFSWALLEIPLILKSRIFRDSNRIEVKELSLRGGWLELGLEFTCCVLERRCESWTFDWLSVVWVIRLWGLFF